MRKLMMAGAATALLTAMPVQLKAEETAIDWSLAETAFQEGRATKGSPKGGKAAAKCAARWVIHNNALNDKMFPEEALEKFDPEIRNQEEAMMNGLTFSRITKREKVYGKAKVVASDLLSKTLAGDIDARQEYFGMLGLCSFDRMPPLKT